MQKSVHLEYNVLVKEMSTALESYINRILFCMVTRNMQYGECGWPSLELSFIISVDASLLTKCSYSKHVDYFLHSELIFKF